MQGGINRRLRRAAMTAILAMSGALAIAAPAGATSATATLNQGTLGLLSVPAVTFSATLNGQNQTPTNAQAIDVGDATGSGAGWNLTGTSTTFTTGGGTPHLLSTAATNITSTPGVACDTSVTCTTSTNAITYPYSLPAASPTAPTATKFFNAAANTGMGNQTVTPTWALSVPANTFAGTYTSTWTISLVSGP